MLDLVERGHTHSRLLSFQNSHDTDIDAAAATSTVNTSSTPSVAGTVEVTPIDHTERSRLNQHSSINVSIANK